MTTALVLGAGLVGATIADDLSSDASFQVTLADNRPAALEAATTRCSGRITTLCADLADSARLSALVEPYDIILGALASPLGFQTLRTIIEAGKNFCDICFMPENALELDDLAKSQGVTAVIDCGVAPGMSHLLAGYGASQLDSCTNIEIYVGGLPRKPTWPFNYKAGFSPADVIEEYTRPARLVENSEIVTREALSEPEIMEFAEVGNLEAFNTDGLRSLLHTLDVPDMKEKTLRYPGHIELMRIFRETGLFSKEPIEVGGVKVKPLDLTSALLFPKWTFAENEEDLTVMRVIVEGTKNKKPTRLTWNLLEYFHQPSHTTSMARTTAIPCAIIARLIANGEFNSPGVIAPEQIGQTPGLYEKIIEEHKNRNILYPVSVIRHQVAKSHL